MKRIPDFRFPICLPGYTLDFPFPSRGAITRVLTPLRSGCLPGHTLDFPFPSRGAIARVFRPSSGNRKSRSAFSLAEVTLALGVAGFCLLAIVGLLQTGLTSEKVIVGQTGAAGILSAVYSDLVSTPSTNTISPNFQFSLTNQTLLTPQTVYFPEAGWTSRVGQAPATNSRYRVSVGIQSTNTGPTPVRILVTWPAAADPTNASGAVEVVTALDRN